MTTADNGTDQNSATAFFEAWQDMIRKSTEAWSQAACRFRRVHSPQPRRVALWRVLICRVPLWRLSLRVPAGRRRAGIRFLHAAVQPGRLHAGVAADVRDLAVAMDEQPVRRNPAAVHRRGPTPMGSLSRDHGRHLLRGDEHRGVLPGAGQVHGAGPGVAGTDGQAGQPADQRPA